MTDRQYGDQPAFPQHGWTSDPNTLARMKESGLGLTKREYLAAAALQGILTDPNYNIIDAVTDSVDVADRLIKELNSKE